MANRYKIPDISTISKRKIFFDANVLIHIYWPTMPKHNEYTEYSNIFGILLKQKNKLEVSSSVISEIINSVMRFEYNKNHKQSYRYYKLFRDSKYGKSVLSDIYDIIKNKIFNRFDISDKEFSKNDIESMLKVDSLDFNDKIILDICKKNNFILVTHDADFSNSDIDILSCNNKLK